MEAPDFFTLKCFVKCLGLLKPVYRSLAERPAITRPSVAKPAVARPSVAKLAVTGLSVAKLAVTGLLALVLDEHPGRSRWCLALERRRREKERAQLPGVATNPSRLESLEHTGLALFRPLFLRLLDLLLARIDESLANTFDCLELRLELLEDLITLLNTLSLVRLARQDEDRTDLLRRHLRELLSEPQEREQQRLDNREVHLLCVDIQKDLLVNVRDDLTIVAVPRELRNLLQHSNLLGIRQLLPFRNHLRADRRNQLRPRMLTHALCVIQERNQKMLHHRPELLVQAPVEPCNEFINERLPVLLLQQLAGLPEQQQPLLHVRLERRRQDRNDLCSSLLVELDVLPNEVNKPSLRLILHLLDVLEELVLELFASLVEDLLQLALDKREDLLIRITEAQKQDLDDLRAVDGQELPELLENSESDLLVGVRSGLLNGCYRRLVLLGELARVAGDELERRAFLAWARFEGAQEELVVALVLGRRKAFTGLVDRVDSDLRFSSLGSSLSWRHCKWHFSWRVALRDFL